MPRNSDSLRAIILMNRNSLHLLQCDFDVHAVLYSLIVLVQVRELLGRYALVLLHNIPEDRPERAVIDPKDRPAQVLLSAQSCFPLVQ